MFCNVFKNFIWTFLLFYIYATQRDIDIAILSVGPSVRLSRAALQNDIFKKSYNVIYRMISFPMTLSLSDPLLLTTMAWWRSG